MYKRQEKRVNTRDVPALQCPKRANCLSLHTPLAVSYTHLDVYKRQPVNVSGTALYNYTEGYGSYLIPAVMIIIIFQTLLMVIGMVTGEEYPNCLLYTSDVYKRQNLHDYKHWN